MLKKTINEGKIIQFESNRTNTKNLHGASCTFLLIIASNLVKILIL
jgi:hydroxymethylpyrimidine/phosphomethylpyrimidine kinase